LDECRRSRWLWDINSGKINAPVNRKGGSFSSGGKKRKKKKPVLGEDFSGELKE